MPSGVESDTELVRNQRGIRPSGYRCRVRAGRAKSPENAADWLTRTRYHSLIHSETPARSVASVIALTTWWFIEYRPTRPAALCSFTTRSDTALLRLPKRLALHYETDRAEANSCMNRRPSFMASVFSSTCVRTRAGGKLRGGRSAFDGSILPPRVAPPPRLVGACRVTGSRPARRSATQGFLADPAVATAVLGAIQSPDTLARIEAAAQLAEVVLPSKAIDHPEFPARARPHAGAAEDRCHERSRVHAGAFRPDQLRGEGAGLGSRGGAVQRAVKEDGALTVGLYSMNQDVVDVMTEATLRAGVSLSINLTGNVYVNQSAAFSDFHATGANPAANASYTDSAFV